MYLPNTWIFRVRAEISPTSEKKRSTNTKGRANTIYKDQMSHINILIVDDEEASRLSNKMFLDRLVANELRGSTLNIQLAQTPKEMFNQIRDEKFHLILLDYDLGRDSDGYLINGIDLIPNILEIRKDTKILVVTSHKDTKLAVKALKNGAREFITKGRGNDDKEYKKQKILQAIKDALFEEESLQSRFISHSNDGYVCQSQAMKIVDEKLKAVSKSKISVLFLGDSGIGKTYAAKRLHELSKKTQNQKVRPFINININAIPDNLIESELFGCEKGSFTDSKEMKVGLIEQARGGDIFLDEIGEASNKLQTKLLKVIDSDDRGYRRIGGTKELKADVRMIFATNQDLEKLVVEGKFRGDLFSRICAITIKLPNLSERKEDIPYICESICKKIKEESKINISFADFPEDLEEYFLNGEFPYNLRSIKNSLERIAHLCPKDNDNINYSTWQLALGESAYAIPRKNIIENLDSLIDRAAKVLSEGGGHGLKEAIRQLEEKSLRETCRKHVKYSRAAQILGISQALMSNKINKYHNIKKGTLTSDKDVTKSTEYTESI